MDDGRLPVAESRADGDSVTALLVLLPMLVVTGVIVWYFVGDKAVESPGQSAKE
jgi:hypothetical protein